MRKFVLLTLVLPPWLAAQTAAPTINPEGIVRSDTTRPGLLPPGMVFSIWGHGYGPKEGCHGPAVEVCGVRVLLDGAPIEVQYTNDVLINARMPEGGPSQPVSRVVVESGGRRSDPAEVRRAPETAVISLDGVARVHGPIWIHVELPRRGTVSYPPWGRPWDFACDSFEVRKDGKPIAPLALPLLGMGYSGPSCPHGIGPFSTEGRTSRLPLHLQYDLTEPGTYEVRFSHYGDFGRRPDDIRSQSAWTPIEVLPASPAPGISVHPQGETELLASFLPDLLARRNDDTLRVLLEYVYHASPRVRSYAGEALYYWPDSEAEPLALEALHTNGPSAALLQRIHGHAAEKAQAAIDYLFSDNPVLFDGAVAAARGIIGGTDAVDPAVLERVEQRLIDFATGNLFRVDRQAINNVISLLGGIHTARVHDLLWNFAEQHTGTEQALIAITWQKDPKDLSRLTDFIVTSASGGYYSIPSSMRSNFGEAAIPSLRSILEKAQSPILRLRCAEELVLANNPAGFAFIRDVFDHNPRQKQEIRQMVNDRFPDTRPMSDAQLSEFLGSRSQ